MMLRNIFVIFGFDLPALFWPLLHSSDVVTNEADKLADLITTVKLDNNKNEV